MNKLRQRAIWRKASNKYSKKHREECRKRSLDYYYKNKEKVLIRHKKLIKKLYNENKNGYKDKQKVRIKTYHKYGKLPDGYQYHHTIPYHEDIWIGMIEGDHNKLLRGDNIGK